MYLFRIAFLASFVLLMASVGAAHAEKCQFNSAAVDPSKYAHRPEFRDFRWNEKKKEARIITSQGEHLKIKHWSCNSWGTEAEIETRPHRRQPLSREEMIAKLIWLAEIIFTDEDKETVAAELKRSFQVGYADGYPSDDVTALHMTGIAFPVIEATVERNSKGAYTFTLSGYLH